MNFVYLPQTPTVTEAETPTLDNTKVEALLTEVRDNIGPLQSVEDTTLGTNALQVKLLEQLEKQPPVTPVIYRLATASGATDPIYQGYESAGKLYSDQMLLNEVPIGSVSPGYGKRFVDKLEGTLSNPQDSGAIARGEFATGVVLFAEVTNHPEDARSLRIQLDGANTVAHNPQDFNPVDSEKGILPFTANGAEHFSLGQDAALSAFTGFRARRNDHVGEGVEAAEVYYKMTIQRSVDA